MTRRGRTAHERPSMWQLPVIGTLLIVATFYLFIASRIWRLTGGTLVYPLDDTYIHMAIAKNVAQRGVWGVSADQFTATSSSPLWTGLLALVYLLTGAHEVTPLILNTLLATLCVVCVGRTLAQEGLAGVSLFAVLAATVLLAPLAVIAWVGMEHTLHILLTVLTVGMVARLVERPSSPRLLALCLLAAAMVSARYEGLFVVAGCALALILARKPGSAVALAAAGAALVAIVGMWNVSHGWFFLPASILLKQAVLQPAGSVLPSSVAMNLAEAPMAFSVLLVAGILLLAYKVATSGPRTVHPFLLVFVTAALIHFAFAKFGHLYRYESYLMVLGTMALGVSVLGGQHPLASARRSRANGELALVTTAVFCVVLGDRTLAANAVTANMAGHIFRQQRQVAALLRTSYDGEPVALNDIGATSYFTRVRITDMVGLASLDVALLRRAGLWDRRHMLDLLDRQMVDVAIVYDTWFPDGQDFHRDWIRVAEWTTDAEETRGEGTVSFFARNATAAARLRRALEAFDAAHPQPAVRRTEF